MSDSELLTAYAELGDEAAFTELVKRHVDLAYSAALRQTGRNHHLAADVVQSVFCDLARKAGQLTNHQLLTGWVYTSIRFAAAKAIRAEERRGEREQKALMMQDEFVSPEMNQDEVQQLNAVLDETMHQLKEAERNAILLRFFEKRTFTEVGEVLGLTADAARMRVERGLEKLRVLLARRGVSASTAALGTILFEGSVTAAPASLMAGIASSVLAGSSVAVGSLAAPAAGAMAAPAAAAETVLTTIKLMGLTKLQAGAIALLVAGASAPLMLQHRMNEELSARNRILVQQNAEYATQLAPLTTENARLSNLLARSTQPTAAGASNEIYRLRAEVTRLREELADPTRARAFATGAPNDPIHATLQNLGARVTNLKQRLEQLPHTRIPEMQYLTEKHWLDAAAALPQMESEEDYRQALNMLRAAAKGEAGGRIQEAIHMYADAHEGTLPISLSEVQAFLEKPVDPEIFERYKMTGTGKLSDLRKEQSLFEEVAAPVDDEYETFIRFHKNGRSTTSYSQIGFMIENATEAYANANGGALPREAGQLMPFLQQPLEPGRIQKFLTKIPPNVTTLAQMKARKN